MKTKYRIVARAHGWAVQKFDTKTVCTERGMIIQPVWRTIATHRFHWLAAFRLAWLREWARRDAP